MLLHGVQFRQDLLGGGRDDGELDGTEQLDEEAPDGAYVPGAAASISVRP